MSNIFKTSILLAAMTALLGWFGMMLGGQQGMIIALVFAGVMNIGSWWFSDKIVLAMYRAQPVESGAIYNMVRDLASRAELPMPKVYIINNPQPNAFATGRNPQNSAVAVTSSITQILSEDELRGVIAHELAHVKNRDTLTMTVTATIAGAISMLSHFAMFFGGGRRDGERGNPIASLALMILAPLAASLVQMAISRVREYSADRGGAQVCGNPLALASALKKIEYSAHQAYNPTAENNPATAPMFIINPLGGRTMDGLFSTHPKTANRVLELEKLAKEGGYSAYSPSHQSSSPQNPWSNS